MRFCFIISSLVCGGIVEVVREGGLVVFYCRYYCLEGIFFAVYGSCFGGVWGGGELGVSLVRFVEYMWFWYLDRKVVVWESFGGLVWRDCGFCRSRISCGFCVRCLDIGGFIVVLVWFLWFGEAGSG